MKLIEEKTGSDQAVTNMEAIYTLNELFVKGLIKTPEEYLKALDQIDHLVKVRHSKLAKALK